MLVIEELAHGQEAEILEGGEFTEIELPRTDVDFAPRVPAFPDAEEEEIVPGLRSPISVFCARDPDDEEEEEEDLDFFADDEEEDDDFEDDEELDDEFDDEEEEEEEAEDDDF